MTTADGSNTLHSEHYQQTYHSTHGAVGESRYVFLQASGVLDRLRQRLPCSVLEVGFGLGLNYLLTADAALSHQTSMEYEAWEHDVISSDQFQELGYHEVLTNPGLADEVAKLLDQVAVDVAGPDSNQKVTRCGPQLLQAGSPERSLALHCGNIIDAQLPEARYDAVYLDAFSPEVNPECWTPTFFARLRRSLKSGGKLATYCAKGQVRRDLQEQGFDVARLPGPPGKREILVAEIRDTRKF